MITSKTIVVATKNNGKVQEFAQFFSEIGINVVGLSEFANLPDVIEDGKTFIENAEKKAGIYARFLHLPVIADDSGLVVDALEGAPGVYSARYAGENATDEDNNSKLLMELTSKGQTGEFLSAAKFVCALVLLDPQDEKKTVRIEGSCEGFIVSSPRGANGFGYDPLFYVPKYECTMAQLPLEQKNKISHRGQALRKLMTILQHDKEL